MQSGHEAGAAQVATAGDVFFSQQPGVQIRLCDVPLQRCVHSRFNTRKARDAERVALLAERIGRNGFERTRSLWGVEVDGRCER